jgi:transposase
MSSYWLSVFLGWVRLGIQELCGECGTQIEKQKYHHLCAVCDHNRRYGDRPASTPSSSSLSPPILHIPSPSFSLLARPASASTDTPLTVERRLGIVGAVEAEASMDIIQQKSSVTLSTIDKLVDRYQTTGTVDDLPRSGRPSLFSDEEKKKIVDASLVPDASGKKVDVTPQVVINRLHLERGSQRTVSRVMDEEGYHGRVCRKSTPLTAEYKASRLSFAREHADWTAAKWCLVIAADETIFPYKNYGQHFCRRKEGEEYNEEYTVDKNKIPSISTNAWGCVSARGTGTLFTYGENTTGQYMKSILNSCLPESRRKLYPTGEWYFMHDNSPTHTDHLVQEWMVRKNIPLIIMPSLSPDLNPIENVWASMKETIRRRSFNDIDELKALVEEVWETLDITFLRHCFESMPHRLESVIEKNGGRIHA